MLWVGVVEGTAGRKNRETVTASVCLVFKGRGRQFGASVNQINQQSPPLGKNLLNQKWWYEYTLLCCEFRNILKVY